jgi:hypothetical protein
MSTRRQCGTCALCCKLFYVKELSKPMDTWCQHCRPGRGGCTIYSDRPAQCRDFACLWLDQRQLAEPLGDEWFPPRCKMVLQPWAEDRLIVVVDPAFPNAWRQEPYYSILRSVAAQGKHVQMRIGRRFIGLHADGSEEEIWRSQAQMEGRAEDADKP